MLYVDSNGMPYAKDRQFSSEGTPDPEIPDRPAAGYTWNGSEWVAPRLKPDWQGLESTLRSSSLFAKAFGTSSANGWSLLLACLHSNADATDTGRLADFQYAIAQIRQGLTSDFTADQIKSFNASLLLYHFPFQVS